MARYADSDNVKKFSGDRYEKIWNISENPSYSGIYRCQTCGYEDVINRECNKLPPCSNCRSEKSSNTWKLLVRVEEIAE